jgi:anti-anti-sigma regulatory factor
MAQTDSTFDNTSLTGYVNLMRIGPILNEIANRSRQECGIQYLLDSSQVTDFSSLALLEICNLRTDLKKKGSDVFLTHCNDHVRCFMFVPLFQSLVA